MTRLQLRIEDLANDRLRSLSRARAQGPILDFEPGGVAVVCREEVRALLADSRLRTNFPEFLRSVGVGGGPFYEWIASSPLNRDGADHQRWRGFMSRTFTPRNVEQLRPLLRRAAHELIDAFASRGRCELVADFADPYPSLGLCALIGVPAEDRDRFRGWANTIALGFSFLVAADIDKVDAALSELLAYAAGLAAERRTAPRDDLVSRIARAAGESGWSGDEVAGFIAGLTFAGHETTRNQIGAMIAVLAEHEDVWDAVATGAASAADVVEETLRLHPAAGDTSRTVAEPVEVAGRRLEAGTPVYLSICSANRDETAYPSPDQFDLGQTAISPHLAFGHGPHHCLGAALARAELQEALLALTTRIGCPSIDAGAEWNTPVGIHGPVRLPLAFTSRQ